MIITVNGVRIMTANKLNIELITDSIGERCPPITINNAGGKLDVYKSDVTTTGPISIHLFSKEPT